MIFIEKMKNMKIYKIPTFLPTIDGNKKKNSSITLLTPNYASTKKLLNHPLFVNKLRFSSYYLERDVSYYINDKDLEEAVYDEEYSVYQLLTEMNTKERNNLKDSEFGIPSKRKFPLDTEKRVRSAIKFFNYVDKEDEKELANNIKKAMKKFGISDIQVGDKNRFKNYYNESVALIESLMNNEKDILYNKEKFDSGEINLCFLTGHSGSGKSTLAHKKEKDIDVDAIELDDLLCIKDHFTMSNLKEYSDLIYSYFNSHGKKFYVGESDLDATPEDQYEDILFRDFVQYAMEYSKSHKDKKYIIEGIWLFKNDSKNKPYFEPNEFNDYAFYIKGTSMIISKYRAAKRDSWDSNTPKRTTLKNFTTKNWKWYRFNEKQLNKFRNYFKKKPETISESNEEDILNESVILEYKNNISFDSSFSLVKKIVDSLTKEELSHICTGEFKNSPYIIYREVLLVNNKPAAFIDIYSIPKEMNKDEAVIVVACNPKFRKNGYVELLVGRAIPIIKKENKIKYLYWETDKSNKASSNIAKKFKFKKAKNFDENDDNYVMNLSESYIEESLEKSDVLFLSDITPENIVNAYKELGVSLPDKVACKVHSGEDGNQNYLRPELWSDLINYVNGTVVECNTAYEGARNTTEKLKELIKKHGWNQFPVDIMDEDFDFELPIEKYNIIDKNYVGSHMRNYSSMIVLSHFKGHAMGGYDGALKQLSIGCASSRGKKFIHGFGSFDNGDRLLADFTGKDEDVVKEDQIKFTEAMADAASSVHNFFNGNIVYINIMSNISRDCDCDSHAEAPCMKDIGILISKDPVAIDQVCLDLVYNSDDLGKDRLIQRIESRFGTHILYACENIGFGNRNYNLIVLDKNNKIEEANINTIYNIIDNSNCKNIIFDLGGVLLKDNKWRDLVKNKCKDLTDKDIDLFVSIYEKFLDKSDTASLNNARVAFISNFENEITKQKALKAFNVLIDTVDPFEYAEDLLKNLQRKGYKLYYLSNWSNYGFNAMKSHGKLDFLKYFNGGLVSYEVGFMKPDIEIYNLFLDKMKIKPKDCIFFDDKYDNIKSAKSIGINGYIWSNLDK